MFKKYIIENNLISNYDKILIAFSGGPDSVFLTEKLLSIKDEFSLSLHLAYVNHNLRDDVENDIEFVKNFSNKYNIDYTILDIKLEKFTEEKARNERYKVLNELLENLKFDKIATGHNLTDNAETILFNIIRGTSLDGLKGINVKRNNIIRPILYISKKDILNEIKNKYIIDKTNLTNDYSRNKIRNLVFPILNEINSNYINNIVKIYENILNNNDTKEDIKNQLKAYDINISSNKLNLIFENLNKNGSKLVDLNKYYYLYKSYDKYEIIKKSDLENKIKNNNEKFILKYNEEISFNGYNIGYKKASELEKLSNNLYNIISLKNFDEDSIFFIRTRIDGDKLDNKKLKKLFIDNKIDKLERKVMPIILFNNNIIMVGTHFKSSLNDKNEYVIYVRREYGK